MMSQLAIQRVPRDVRRMVGQVTSAWADVLRDVDPSPQRWAPILVVLALNLATGVAVVVSLNWSAINFAGRAASDAVPASP
ncbi:MAG: hypothetical protein M3336_17245, partial [Chloroflexota bacterium]|nr:hypothetical protein [Chloroflexota bacterium]